MSMFKWRPSGGWLSASWAPHYKWQTRELKTMNSWISQLRHESLSIPWENSVSIARSA